MRSLHHVSEQCMFSCSQCSRTQIRFEVCLPRKDIPFESFNLQPHSSTMGVLKTHAGSPVASDCQRHKDTAIFGQLAPNCFHQGAGHLEHVHVRCTHYGAQFRSECSSIEAGHTAHLREARFIEKASHADTRTCSRHYHAHKMNFARLIHWILLRMPGLLTTAATVFQN